MVEALVGLGFAVKQAEQAVDAVLAEKVGLVENGAAADSKADTSATLRAALAILGRSR